MGEEAFGTNSVGSGPYKFVSYDTNDKVMFTAYKGYYKEQPAIKDVTSKLIQRVLRKI